MKKMNALVEEGGGEKKKEWGIAGPKGWDQVDTVECECAVASEKAFSVLSFFSSSHFLRYILHVEIYGSE